MAMRAEFADFRGAEAREIRPSVYKDYVLEDLLAWRQAGLQTALVTLVRVEGSSPRPVGSQLAVASDGRAVGAVTGGCAEQAIILDALSVMARGGNHVELYGKGSRFKDISLPCGSGVHMAFDVTLTDDRLEALVAAHRARRVSIYACESVEGIFERVYRPQNRLVIFGRGHIVPALAQMAHLNEFDVHVFSPDDETRRLCDAVAITWPLNSATSWDHRLLDTHTAVTSLFHDHDGELEILSTALRSDAFYIGALGSRKTHALRLETLVKSGWTETDCARIDGPAGLDIAARTPPEIALSIMAKVVSVDRFKCV